MFFQLLGSMQAVCKKNCIKFVKVEFTYSKKNRQQDEWLWPSDCCSSDSPYITRRGDYWGAIVSDGLYCCQISKYLICSCSNLFLKSHIRSRVLLLSLRTMIHEQHPSVAPRCTQTCSLQTVVTP